MQPLTGDLDADVAAMLAANDTYMYAVLVRRYGRKQVQAAIQRREHDHDVTSG